MRFLRSLKKFNRKALVIVAHPDDESLFIGGTIAEFKKWRWMILCATDCDERRNRQRRREFLKACRVYRRNGADVTPFMLDIVKRGGRFSKKEIGSRIKEFIKEFGPFDMVFTHGRIGEYGHKTHKLIHSVTKKLKLRNVYNFYIPLYVKTGRPLGIKYAGGIQAVELSLRSLQAKKRALNIYLKGSQKTNLSRLKKIVTRALNTRRELYSSAN